MWRRPWAVLPPETPHLVSLGHPTNVDRLQLLLHNRNTALSLHTHRNPQHHTRHIDMALKRINKELTDLGRYVDPFSPQWRPASPFARTTLCESGVPEHGDGAATLRYS